MLNFSGVHSIFETTFSKIVITCRMNKNKVKKDNDKI